MREVNPARARLFQIDPIINVVPRSDRDEDVRNAETIPAEPVRGLGHDYRPSAARSSADVTISSTSIGVNYYIHNQFVWQGQ